MKSSLLILLYLIRDTVHRWLIRLSSPLARFMVVLFLSFCGLAFLSSYVLSVEVLRYQVARSGADLIVATEMMAGGTVHAAGHGLLAPRPQEYKLHTFHEAFMSAMVGEHPYPLVEYMPDGAGLFPRTEKNGVFLLPEHPRAVAGPENVKVEEHTFQAVSLPETKLLSMLYPGGAVFFPYGSLQGVWQHGFIRKYVLRLHEADIQSIGRWENTINALARMDRRNMTVVSSKRLLAELAEMEATQYRFRVGVSVGISVILCLLLTAVSSLEFRHNEYVYALMGSFGVSRVVLFLTFVAENTVLVAAGFATALWSLMLSRHYITDVLYHVPGLELDLWALEDDIRTFCLAFAICIPVSCLPILAAVWRPIGKILK